MRSRTRPTGLVIAVCLLCSLDAAGADPTFTAPPRAARADDRVTIDFAVNGKMGGCKIKVYNREGKHQKALTPVPADIAAEKVKALGVFRTAEGDLVPHVHNWETLSFYPDHVGVRGRDMPQSSSPAVDSRG